MIVVRGGKLSRGLWSWLGRDERYTPVNRAQCAFVMPPLPVPSAFIYAAILLITIPAGSYAEDTLLDADVDHRSAHVTDGNRVTASRQRDTETFVSSFDLPVRMTRGIDDRYWPTLSEQWADAGPILGRRWADTGPTLGRHCTVKNNLNEIWWTGSSCV